VLIAFASNDTSHRSPTLESRVNFAHQRFLPDSRLSPRDEVGGAMRLTQATLLSLAMTGGLAVVSVAPATAQNDFQWRGRLSAGQANRNQRDQWRRQRLSVIFR
jgi:hypothetical protein